MMAMIAPHGRDDRDDRIAELEEEIRQLRVIAFGEGLVLPRQWRLTGTEGKLVRCLLARELVNWPVFEAAMRAGRWDYDCEEKILDVYVCKARKKLHPFGVEIETRWGQGYTLSPTMKDAIKAACETGDPVVAPPIVREVKPHLTASLVEFVGQHPNGVHITEIRASFADRPGAVSILSDLAEKGVLTRAAKSGHRRGYTYYPARARN